MLQKAATSPSVNKELKGAVRGLDGFLRLKLGGYMGLFGSPEGSPEAPKKI